MGRFYWHCPTCGAALTAADPPGNDNIGTAAHGHDCAVCAERKQRESLPAGQPGQAAGTQPGNG